MEECKGDHTSYIMHDGSCIMREILCFYVSMRYMEVLYGGAEC